MGTHPPGSRSGGGDTKLHIIKTRSPHNHKRRVQASGRGEKELKGKKYNRAQKNTKS